MGKVSSKIRIFHAMCNFPNFPHPKSFSQSGRGTLMNAYSPQGGLILVAYQVISEKFKGDFF